MSALVNLVVMTGMLLVVPLGLRLAGVPGGTRRIWAAGAVAGAAALWLPRGPAAVALAACYAAAALAVAARAPRRRWRADAAEAAVALALVMPLVAATALVAERGGLHLFGFSLRILSLTVAHFHFAGFAAALIAGLVGRTAGPGRRAAAASVPLGTLVVLAGYFTGEWVEFAGAVVLTAGMWLVGWLTWRDVRPAGDRAARALLLASSAVLAATMVLALWWALGEASGLVHPTLGWMAATHGVGNALGFGLCGMLAWSRVKRDTEGRRRA
ncbi:YndJ family protein [Actinomadura parmotrematis]|uniref:YndJ family protein n=1 Tax=Actinomadura parmotrematis TaxID=2864039 RepID=A0ABS7FVM5_9ACTN|nr:YndJ family protein [Actinomadura parmotrematis]MBW8483627.1 YndJ family protein [Actinomadura parmotrematis]